METQIQILQFLERLRTPELTITLTAITIAAEQLLISATLAVIYWCVDKTLGKRLAWMLLFSGCINGLTKNLVRVRRPFEVGVVKPLRAHTATSYSFPSGHTQNATSFWGGLMLLFRQPALIWIGAAMVLLTGFSRLYLGVHWPMDVLGGMAFGAISILLASKFVGQEGQVDRRHLLLASVALLCVLVLPMESDFCKAVASLWGLTGGMFLEQKWVRFTARQPWPRQILKLAIGFGGYLALYWAAFQLLPPAKFFYLSRYALLLVWITAGAPYCFIKMTKTGGLSLAKE